MKKIIFISLLLIAFFTANAQIKGYTVHGTISVTADNYLILNGDTIGNFYSIGTDTIVDKAYVDSLSASLPGGHDAVTVTSTAEQGGWVLTGQQLSQFRATSSQSGWLHYNDFQGFYNKLSSVTHDSYFSGLGTVASPLKLDTTYFKSWADNIWLKPDGNLTGTFNGQNAAYYLNYNNFTNTPTISDDAFGISWDANLDLATKNTIYDAIVAATGTVTDLTWLRYPTYGIMASSTGAADTIHAVDATYAGLMLPEDKIGLGDITVITLSDGLKTVGSVIWTSGLSFDITPALYYITSERYESGYDSVTLSAADVTYSRIDVIALDTLEQAVVIEGTPSANPQKPSVDPTAYVELTYVLVQANATEPSNPGTGDSITTVVVYDENMEWTGTASGFTYNFSGTTAYIGSIGFEATDIAQYDIFSFTDTEEHGFSEFSSLSFYIKLKGSLPAKHRLQVQLRDNLGLVSDYITVSLANTTDWQPVAVPMGEFTGTLRSGFTGIRFRYISKNTGDTFSGFYLDRVVLQGGIEQPTPTEYQELSTDGTAGNISISNGNTITLNVDDGDADPTNELQVIDTFQIINNILQISLSDDGEPVKTVGLASYLDNTDNQTAAEVPYTNTTSGLTATDVQAAIDEIDATIDNITLTGGDNWGNDVVNSDITLSGNGTTGSPLKVDTTLIATIIKTNQLINDSIATLSFDGDNWGTQAIVSDATLTGVGTVASPLKVDTTLIATITQTRSEISDSISGISLSETDPIYSAWNKSTGISITESQISDFGSYLSQVDTTATHIVDANWRTYISNHSSGGSSSLTLTGEVTGTGTGTVSTTVADNVIDYGNVATTLKDSLVNNTLAWDISTAGIIYCTPSTGTVSFTNKQKNKNVVVVLSLSSATITWPAEAKILDGSATLGDGTFYVFIQCISDSIVLVSITKEAS